MPIPLVRNLVLPNRSTEAFGNGLSSQAKSREECQRNLCRESPDGVPVGKGRNNDRSK